MSSSTFVHSASGPCTLCRGKKSRFLSLDRLVICEDCVHLCEVRFTEAVEGSDELRREMSAVSAKERDLYEEHVRTRVATPNEIACSFCQSVPALQIHILAAPQHYICKPCVERAARAIKS